MMKELKLDTEYAVGEKIVTQDGSIIEVVALNSCVGCYISKIKHEMISASTSCPRRFRCMPSTRIDCKQIQYIKIGEIEENYVCKDLPMNSEFVIDDGSILRVLGTGDCAKCYYKDKTCCVGRQPWCTSDRRKDKESVCFIKVGSL